MTDNNGGGAADMDTLAGKIAKMLGRNKAPGDDDSLDDYGRRADRVPYDRFQAKVNEVKALREQLAEVGAEFSTFKEQSSTWRSEFEAAHANSVTELGTQHQHSLSLVEAGIKDPLGRQAVRAAWDRAPKSTRGANHAEWFEGLVQARSAAHLDESLTAPDIPRTLAGYLPELQAPPPATTKGRPPPRRAVSSPRRPVDGDTGLSALGDDASISDIVAALDAQ